MRVLVTGATGQIGRVTVARLTAAGHSVQALALRDPGALDRMDTDIDVVVHLGAQTNAYLAREDLGRDVRDTLIPFVDLLARVARTDRPPLVILAGSATQSTDRQYYSPTTFYDVAKCASQMYLEQASAEGWVRGITLRLSNVFGGPTPDGHPRPRGFLNACIERALDTEIITIFGDGTQLRDYIHVDDVAALITAAVGGEQAPGGPASFEVGSGTSTSLIASVELVLDLVEERIGQRSRLVHQPWPMDAYAVETRSATIDPTPAMHAFGWAPAISLREGIARAIRARLAS